MAIALKRISAPVAEAPAAKSDVPVVKIAGTHVTAYNKAVAAQKEAEAIVAEHRPDVLKDAMKEFHSYNIKNPVAPASSIKVMDENGSVILISGQNKYSAVNADICCGILDQIAKARGTDAEGKPLKEIDPNEFVQEVVAPKFDTGVLYNQDKSFNEEIFAAYQKAIAACTEQLVKDGKLAVGTASPLVGERKFMPKATFHTARWSAFPKVSEQRALQEALPNTVTLKPVLTVEPKAPVNPDGEKQSNDSVESQLKAS
jgi:hypothetical protein